MDVPDTATEADLIKLAREVTSEEKWIVGRCASLWTKRHARGRTDADFGSAVGMSGDQIFSRRRVWETFADVKTSYPHLEWSHFNVALTWEDSAECLQWAEENQATVAEMKAWRRLQHGEDLTTDADENCSESESVSESVVGQTILSVSGAADTATATDKIVRPTGDGDEFPERSGNSEPARRETVAAMGDSERAYAPYVDGARKPAAKRRPEDDPGDPVNKDAVLIRKTCITVDQAIRHTDDATALVTELLSTCWKYDQGETAKAVKAFYDANPLCRG